MNVIASPPRPRWVVLVEGAGAKRGFYTGTRNDKGQMVLAPTAHHSKTLAYVSRGAAEHDREIARNLARGGAFRFWVEQRAER